MQSSAVAQAAASMISSTLLLERVRAIRFDLQVVVDCSLFAASFARGALPFTRFVPGSPVLRQRLKYSPGDRFLEGVLNGRVCSLKGQQSTDDRSSSCNPASFPPHGPSRMSDAVGSPGSADATLAGEDAAAFDIANQSMSSWLLFTAILSVLLAILYVVWIDPETGYGSEHIGAIPSLSDSHEMVMLIILFAFALVHCGLASLRGAVEQLIGERAHRVIYATSSLPLAVSAVVYHLFYDELLTKIACLQTRSYMGFAFFFFSLLFGKWIIGS